MLFDACLGSCNRVRDGKPEGYCGAGASPSTENRHPSGGW